MITAGRLPALGTPRVAAAALALLLALGLPWGVVGPETVYQPGWGWGSFCYLDLNGWMVCTPGNSSTGTLSPGQGMPYAGYQTSARVTIFLGLVLIGLWWRAGGTWQLPLAAALQPVAVALSGSALRPGAMAALIAAVLLLTEPKRPAETPQRN